VIVDPKIFTTLAFVTLDETGNRSFDFARKPGADTMLTWAFSLCC
jgi:fructokinase